MVTSIFYSGVIKVRRAGWSGQNERLDSHLTTGFFSGITEVDHEQIDDAYFSDSLNGTRLYIEKTYGCNADQVHFTQYSVMK